GATEFNKEDDYPDLIIPLAKALSDKKVDGGVADCGSGVVAAIAANKVTGVRAVLINDYFSAYQPVDDDYMIMICLEGRFNGFAADMEYILSFLNVRFSRKERHVRRLNKVKVLEK